jgi:RNA polymerase sigma-70 factor (ECF subfamily)
MAFSAAGHVPAPMSSARVDDTILIRRSQQGDTTAFEELVRNYDRSILRLTMHLTDSTADAQDIYQETFLRAYRNIGRFRFECSFYTWIYRIVTNLCLDHLRRNRKRRDDVAMEGTVGGEEYNLLNELHDARAANDPEQQLLGRELGAHISSALQALTPRERMVFELKHFQGLRLRAVGQILNTSEASIKTSLFRATQKLRFRLAGLTTVKRHLGMQRCDI